MALNQILALIPGSEPIGSLGIDNPRGLIKLVNLAIVEHDVNVEMVSEKSTGDEFKAVLSQLPEENVKEILEEHFLGCVVKEKEDTIETLAIEEKKFKLGAMKVVVYLSIISVVVFLILFAYISITTGKHPDPSVSNAFISNMFEIFKIIFGK